VTTVFSINKCLFQVTGDNYFIPPLYRTGGMFPSLSISFGDMLSGKERA